MIGKRTNVRGLATAFTLVELLVVIGIIALLIAILMPALSRARKQALEVSCGSNERQIAYAMIAYGNDWQEQLPTRVGRDGNFDDLFNWARLPIIGFDTFTVISPLVYFYNYLSSSVGPGLGGLAFVMRDYVKNDWDVMVCPDGFYSKRQVLRPCLDGSQTSASPAFVFVVGDFTATTDLFSHPGYLWLAQRKDFSTDFATYDPCGTGRPAYKDNPRDIAKTASDKPDLLLIADFVFIGTIWGSPTSAPLYANHIGTGVRGASQASGVKVSMCNPNANNPDDMPLGSNRARIDCRTSWVPWQDITLTRYFATTYGWQCW